MPVEIREITIKTEINTTPESSVGLNEQELATLKAKMLEECKNELDENTKRVDYDR